MSRLAGRVTFPGESFIPYFSYIHGFQPAASNKNRFDAQDRPQKSRPHNNYRSDRYQASNNELPDSGYSRPQEGRPRGKGPVRYQGNYSDRFDAKRENNGSSGRFLDRCEKPQNNRRREQRFEKFEKPQRSEREQDLPKLPRKPTRNFENVMPSEELLDVEDIINQISDLNVRSERSAAQIKRNILGSEALIDTMDEDDWQKVCESMLMTALEQGEPEFISDLVVAFFKNEMFAAVMSDELLAVSSKHIMEKDAKPIPGLLASLLCAHWPRQFSKAVDNINPILYTIVCIIKGWIEVVSEDTQRYHKDEKKPRYQTKDDAENESECPKGEKPEDTVIEDPELVNSCAVALAELCDTAQRRLWVNWMTLTDEIYVCLKPTITHNPNITGSVKARLLDTFIQMNQWTKRPAASFKHTNTQTVSTSSE